VRYFRLRRLVDECTRYAAIQKLSLLLNQLARVELRVNDDFGLAPIADQAALDLLELLDGRYDRASTLTTSQLPKSGALTRASLEPRLNGKCRLDRSRG
jgi:hypothetical protein